MVEYLLTYLHDGSKFETDLVRMGFQMAALAFVFTPPHKNIRSVCRYIARAMALTLTIMLCSFVFLPKQETLVPILGGFGLLLIFFIGYSCLFYKKSRDIRLAMILSFTVAGFSVNGLSYCFGTILDQKWPGHTMLFLCMNNCLLVAYCIVVRKYSLDRFLSVLHSGNVLLSVINFIGLATTILTLWINFRVRVMDEFCAVIFFLTYIMSVGVCGNLYAQHGKYQAPADDGGEADGPGPAAAGGSHPEQSEKPEKNPARSEEPVRLHAGAAEKQGV